MKARVRERVLSCLGRALGPQQSARVMLEQAILDRLYDPKVGAGYGVTRAQKVALAGRFRRTTAELPSGTSAVYHVVLATEILNIPPSVRGDVIECGCWKGASTSSLSLACKLVGRRLFVCDSFEGLPQDDPTAVHTYPHIRAFGYYQQGMYSGRLEEVMANVARCGDLSVCHFVKGYFNETLKDLTGPFAFAFADVDLVSSLKDCLKHIWPKLVEGGLFYTDDSGDMETVRPWFDGEWWKRELGQEAPGYVGSGCGLPVSPVFSTLGYSRKVRSLEGSYGRVSWLYYPDQAPQGATPSQGSSQSEYQRKL
jgi:hypothetical protein